MLWVYGGYKHSDTSPPSANSRGWVQVSRQGRILNEAFCTGAPGFGWASKGPLNWEAESTFNPYVSPELRLALLVNGVEDIEAQAEALDLPANWRDHRVA